MEITEEEFRKMFEILKNNERIVYSFREELQDHHSFILRFTKGFSLELQFPSNFGRNGADGESIFAIVEKNHISIKGKCRLIYIKLPHLLEREFSNFLFAKWKNIRLRIKRKERRKKKNEIGVFRKFLGIN